MKVEHMRTLYFIYNKIMNHCFLIGRSGINARSFVQTFARDFIGVGNALRKITKVNGAYSCNFNTHEIRHAARLMDLGRPCIKIFYNWVSPNPQHVVKKRKSRWAFPKLGRPGPTQFSAWRRPCMKYIRVVYKHYRGFKSINQRILNRSAK